MKNILLFINIIALIISAIWLYTSNYSFEPIVVILTLLASLLGIYFSGNNSAKVIGNENKVTQKKTGSFTDIEGDKNEIIQG